MHMKEVCMREIAGNGDMKVMRGSETDTGYLRILIETGKMC